MKNNHSYAALFDDIRAGKTDALTAHYARGGKGVQRNGQTLLMCAIDANNSAAIDMILATPAGQWGLNNLTDRQGNTALHYAYTTGNQKLVDQLSAPHYNKIKQQRNNAGLLPEEVASTQTPFIAQKPEAVVINNTPAAQEPAVLPIEQVSLPVSQTHGLDFSLAQDGLENRISHLYHSGGSDNFSSELAELGKRYEFEVIEQKDVQFSLLDTGTGTYKWMEDNMWLSADGSLAFQPQIALYDTITQASFTNFITALDKDTLGAEEEGHHSLGDQNLKVRIQGLNSSTLKMADSMTAKHKMKMEKKLSVIDGGNMLTGRRADDQPYVLIGRDAVLQTTLVHSSFDQERIAVCLEAMQADGTFSLIIKSYDSEYDSEYDSDDDESSPVISESKTSYYQYGYDPEIDLMLLDAAGMVSEKLTNTEERLEFARLARARAELVMSEDERLFSIRGMKRIEPDNMNLSPEQKAAIIQRCEVLYGGPLPVDFQSQLMGRFEFDYQTLIAGQKSSSIYTDVMINEKLQHFEPKVEAVSRMVTMLQTGGFMRKSLSAEDAAYQARRFLAMTEISKDNMAKELNVLRQNLVVISQPDFHIDMYLRPLADGRVLVHDDAESQKLVQRVLNNESNKLTESERENLQETVSDLEQSSKERKLVNELIYKQLQDAGLQVIKAPGVFSVGKRQPVNYMNGIMGTSPAGEMFYITNASTIEPLNQIFSQWIQEKQAGLNVHFVGGDNGFMERTLGQNGGLDCITLHHGPKNSLLAQQMAAFPGQSDSVNALPASGMAADKITAQLPSYSAGNNQPLVT